MAEATAALPPATPLSLAESFPPSSALLQLHLGAQIPRKQAQGCEHFHIMRRKGCTLLWSLNTKGAQQQHVHRIHSGEGFAGAAEAGCKGMSKEIKAPSFQASRRCFT